MYSLFRKRICLTESAFPIGFSWSLSSASGRTTVAEVHTRAHFAGLVADVDWITYYSKCFLSFSLTSL